jgi:hypothetical protein
MVANPHAIGLPAQEDLTNGKTYLKKKEPVSIDGGNTLSR